MCGYTFIPKAWTEFEDSFETPEYKSFQPEFRSGSQFDVTVRKFDSGCDKSPSDSSSSGICEYGCLHLEVMVSLEELTDTRNDAGPQTQSICCWSVDLEIHMTVANAGFLIL